MITPQAHSKGIAPFSDLLEVLEHSYEAQDTFAEVLYEVLTNTCESYCKAVDWRHSPDMMYVTAKLENLALEARTLILEWLGRPHMVNAPVRYILRDGLATVPRVDLWMVDVRSYDEVRIVNRRLVQLSPRDQRAVSRIDRALGRLIGELKALIT